MPSSNSAFDAVVDEIIEMPLFYQVAKTFLQLNPFPPCQFACSMSLASLSNIQGNNELALQEINRAIKLEPKNADAHLQKAIILSDLKRHAEAIASLETHVSLAPKSVEGWTLLGNEQFNHGLHSRSVSSFECALKISPNYLDALTGYCTGLYVTKRYSEIPTIAILGLKHPDATPAIKAHHHTHLGLAYIQLQQPESALRNLQIAAEFKPKDITNWLGLSHAYLLMDKNAEALQAALKALSLESNHQEAIAFAATALSSLDRDEEALELYDKLTVINENHPCVWGDRGGALAKLKRFDEAFKSCQRAIKQNEANSTAWVNYGYAYELMGNYAEAINCYQQALIHDSRSMIAWNNLGSVYAELFIKAVSQNDFSLAANQWDEAVKCGRKGNHRTWPEEEFNYLFRGLKTGQPQFIRQCWQTVSDNPRVAILGHVLDFLVTRDIDTVISLPAETRVEVEKLINQC